jgi:L-alanine-DL-glutamate epimerase-like enolase superfamily enzyme
LTYNDATKDPQCLPQPSHHRHNCASPPLDTWAPPPQFAGKPRTHVDMLLVRVTTSGGVVGWGEAYGSSSPMIPIVFDSWIKHVAIGQDATDHGLTARLERLLHGFGRCGPVVHAISGLDIALWDIRGKLEGKPVSRCSAGTRRKRVEAYASLLQYGGSIEHVRRNVARALERGYRHLKLHERTADSVAAARDVAGPDIPIMVDTNCAWTADQATAPVAAMAPVKSRSGSRSRSGRRRTSTRWRCFGAQRGCRWRWARMRPACSTSKR